MKGILRNAETEENNGEDSSSRFRQELPAPAQPLISGDPSLGAQSLPLLQACSPSLLQAPQPKASGNLQPKPSQSDSNEENTHNVSSSSSSFKELHDWAPQSFHRASLGQAQGDCWGVWAGPAAALGDPCGSLPTPHILWQFSLVLHKATETLIFPLIFQRGAPCPGTQIHCSSTRKYRYNNQLNLQNS